MSFSKKKLSIVLVIALALFSFKQADDYFEVSKNLEIFSAVYKELHTGYVDEIKPGDMMKKGIDAMMMSLDPYTNFYTESQAEDAMIQRSGEFGGIGCSSMKRGDYIYITVVHKGLPADIAGLKVGDKLLEINGKSFIGKSIDESSNALRGAPNTKLNITIDRAGNKLSMEITRQEIKTKNVTYYGMVNQEVGYMKLEHFMAGAGEEVKNALVDLKSKGAKNIILDLRDNGGGLLHEAVHIVNVFVPINTLVTTTKGRLQEEFREYFTLNNAIDAKIPLVVLVNQYSASASEIVSGAIQDLDRGIVIGRNTFGKGLVQNTRSLPYRTQMKLTVAKYYIPSGRCIQLLDYSKRNSDGSAGIIPDSLRKAFKTKNNRKVFDGGGVKPDILVDDAQKPNIVKLLESNYIYFDYATHYFSKNKQISDSKTFTLSETDYQDFKSYISSNQFTYTTSSETAIKQLKEKLKNDAYDQQMANEIAQLENKMNAVKSSDLDKNKNEILKALQLEIVRRYYYEESKIENSFAIDEHFKKALDLFNDPVKYNQLLSPLN
jgi:carboxyl-terminal processing protease